MHLLNLVRRALSTALLTTCGTLCAAPVSFEFDLPDWGACSPGCTALYGLNATIQITVDNGNASTTSQAYRFGDITKLFVQSGVYSNIWLASDAYIEPDLSPDFALIFTDAVGAPTLDLTAEPDPGGLIVFSNSVGTWAFGLGKSSNGSYTAVWLQDGPDFSGDARAFNLDSSNYKVLGSVVDSNAVPLPESSSLVLLGLACLSFSTRKWFRGVGSSSAQIALRNSAQA